MNTTKETIVKISQGQMRSTQDTLVVEEPLEIQLAYWQGQELIRKAISVTMRTPGADEALALGFLYTEGIIDTQEQVTRVFHLPDWSTQNAENRIVVGIAKGVELQLHRLERHFYTGSSCGICGKASIEAVRATRHIDLSAKKGKIHYETIVRLPQTLRRFQSVFEATGGIHATGLFDTSGRLLLLHEDVGRHNAVDKIVGSAFQNDRLPLDHQVMLVSGRLSFEIVQKALMAEVPILVAVGAPSHLAVELARAAGMTLIGFVKKDQCNVYCGSERVVFA